MLSECDRVAELLQRFVDGDISSRDFEFVENHIADCHKCLLNVTSYKKTVSMIQELYESKKNVFPSLSDPLINKIMSRIQNTDD